MKTINIHDNRESFNRFTRESLEPIKYNHAALGRSGATPAGGWRSGLRPKGVAVFVDKLISIHIGQVEDNTPSSKKGVHGRHGFWNLQAYIRHKTSREDCGGPTIAAFCQGSFDIGPLHRSSIAGPLLLTIWTDRQPPPHTHTHRPSSLPE